MRLINHKERSRRIFLAGALVFILIVCLAVFVIAEQSQTLQEELAQLENELNSPGYSWLVNYTLDYSQYDGNIDVYLLNGSESIARIENISTEGMYKTYLTGLGNTTSDVFDLRINSANGIEFDWIVDPEIVAGNENGLVALYHLNNQSAYGENDTRVYDFSGLGNNGTVYGGAVWNSSGGILGTGAFMFDGQGNDYVIVNVSNYTTKSYWSYINSVWTSIIWTNNITYVNGRSACPENMSYINKLGGYCIDQYEASMPSANSSTIGNSSDVARIATVGTMSAVSQGGVVPWVSVNQTSARKACTNAGKHLCTDEEWLGASNVRGRVYNLPTNLAVAPYYCVTDSSTYCLDHSYSSGEACNTGRNKTDGISKCVSAEGVYDMTGNVWEWTNNTVNTTKPSTCNPVSDGWCYLNSTGVFSTSTTGASRYGNDGVYFLANSSSNRAVRRGGAWNYGAGCGPFSVDLSSAPSTAHGDIGFRCCSGVS